MSQAVSYLNKGELVNFEALGLSDTTTTFHFINDDNFAADEWYRGRHKQISACLEDGERERLRVKWKADDSVGEQIVIGSRSCFHLALSHATRYEVSCNPTSNVNACVAGVVSPAVPYLLYFVPLKLTTPLSAWGQ